MSEPPYNMDRAVRSMVETYSPNRTAPQTRLTKHLQQECDYEVESLSVQWTAIEAKELKVWYCPFCGEQINPRYKPPNQL